MRRIFTLARKDLLETRRDRLALIFTVVMPVAFTAFFGLLFGGGSDRLPLAVWSGDAGPVATQLIAQLQKSEVVVARRVTQSAAEQNVADNKVAAALEIPAGFSAAVAAGKPATLTVVGVSGSSGAQTASTEISALAGQAVAAEQAARAAVATVVAVERPLAASSVPSMEAAALAKVRPVTAQALAHPAATIKVVEAGAAAGQVPSGFVLSSPGMLINFILFSLTTAGVALIVERKNFTLMRLMTTRVRRSELIAGKILGMFALTFVQQIILIGIGQFLFGVDYLRDPAALLLMMIALSAVASTLGLMLASLLKTQQAMIAATVLTSMSVAALSGAWFPLEITGPAFQFVGHLLPTSWILDGFRGIVLRGFGVPDVMPAFGFALAWALGLFAIAVWRFRLTD
ncbi:MAG TPA: ABC transporter permease [Thermoleophilia bacterium]|nr:ABC transporter permease [Thermoleophilia bacterium]